MADSRLRSFVKAVFWRLTGITTSLLLGWVFFREIVLVVSFAVFYHLSNIILNYFYERVWERISWGRK